ncbi:hypothetical protein [Azospirillum palustre]
MKTGRLIEVWGDTVDSVHLGLAMAIGCAISLGAFLLANRILAGLVAAPEMARAYSMLVGLAGCLVAGALCARLFPPKREVVDRAADPAWRETLMAELRAEPGGFGRLADLPPAAVAELKEMGLYDLFAAEERDAAAASRNGPSVRPDSNRSEPVAREARA